MLLLANKLGQFPYLEYASSYALQNRVRKEVNKGVEFDNLRRIIAFEDAEGSKKGPILVHVDMVAHSGIFVSAAEDAPLAAANKARDLFTTALEKLYETYKAVNFSMDTMWGRSKPSYGSHLMLLYHLSRWPAIIFIEILSGLAWDISSDGTKQLSEVDDTGDSIFHNVHIFYRDALKVGPELDVLTVNFLQHLEREFDTFEAKHISRDMSFLNWSKMMLGTASANAMMGPALLRDATDLLPSVWLVEHAFVLFINRSPRIFARKYSSRARDHVLSASTSYFEDEKNKEGSALMMWERASRWTTRDIAAYSYAAYAALLNSTNPTAYWILRRIFSRKDLLARLRDEVAPAFATGNSITTLEQVQHLLTSCPLRAFYDETLRLHSSSSSNRVVVKETSIGGYTLKVGRAIILPSYAQHHLPEFFGEAPGRFDPERFNKPVLENGEPADAKMVRAFGGGVSLCPGRFFASNEVLSYAANVLWRFDITFKGEGMVSIVPRKRE